MASLVIQDVFEPYYAGRRSATPEKPQAQQKPRPAMSDQKKALEQVRANAHRIDAEKPREA